MWTNALVSIGMAGIVVCIFLEYRRLRRRRGQHVSSRTSMAEAEFVDVVGIIAEQAQWAIKLRDGFAKAMVVPAETVYPTDTIKYVSSFGFDNHSWGEINICLSNALSFSIPKKFWEPLVKGQVAGEITVAEVIRFFVEHRTELD